MFLYLYSVLGVFLFAPIKLQGALDVHANFQTFLRAFLTLVRCSTGEAWNEIMADTSRYHSFLFVCEYEPTYDDYASNNFETVGCGNFYVGSVFFVSFLLIVTFIFLNLFIAIILEGFHSSNQSENLTLPDHDF